MMCMTGLHDGGVCHRTSTPHKSGNKMKEKKKIYIACLVGRTQSNTFQLTAGFSIICTYFLAYNFIIYFIV